LYHKLKHYLTPIKKAFIKGFLDLQGIVDDVRTKIMEIEEIYIPDLAPAA